MKKLNKKAQVGNLTGFIMAIGVASVVLGVVLIILQEFQGTTTANTAAYNAIGTTITKMGTVPTWIGLIIIAGLAFIVLGFFMVRGGSMA